jgi:hypothetical protein
LKFFFKAIRVEMDAYLVFSVFSLVFASIRDQVSLEQVLKLLREGGELGVVRVLDRRSADDRLKELSLQHDLHLIVDVIGLDA